jgi:hypothetical protein
MSYGRIVTQPDGKQFHVGGRKRVTSRGPRLSLKNYIDKMHIGPSPDCDYTPNALGLSDVLGNNALGCCTCSGVGHLIDTVTGAAGEPVAIMTEQVIALYEASCKYDPMDPSSDQGGDELTVLDYVAEKGIDGKGLHQFVGSVLVDATSQLEVRFAQYTFGNLYFGESMPNAYTDPFPSEGDTWDVEGDPNPEDGHCFVGTGSTSKGIWINTWGIRVLHTYAAMAKYATFGSGGELHTVLTRDWLNCATERSPTGLAYEDLVSDLAKIGAISS